MTRSTTIDDVDYGPLASLVGMWRGDKGVDIAPEPDGIENNPYYETLLFEAIGDTTNGEEQVLAVLRYHQMASRKSNDKVFHNETGYWCWDFATDIIFQTFTIPRGVCVIAGGQATETEQGLSIDVIAKADDPDWSILQTPFMRDKAKTLKFTHNITLTDDTLSYKESTFVDIYGKIFDHKDKNQLHRQ